MAAAVQVVGGVDPHADTIHVAALTAVGKVVGDAEFPATAAGYVQAVQFLTAKGVVERVGVEGAACYGAGITRALTAAGIPVVEWNGRPGAAGRVRGRADGGGATADHRRHNLDRLISEPSFAALCGVAPVPASSGKTWHMRLSRGGDRQANHALHRFALVRMSHHAPARVFVARQRAKGRATQAILRLLKRAIAREIYRYLTRHVEVPDYADLRPARQAKNIALTTVADHFGVWPAVISCLERGQRRDDQLAQHYRTWLAAA